MFLEGVRWDLSVGVRVKYSIKMLMSQDELEVEESVIDVVGIIPAQLKDFTSITIEQVTPKEIYLKLDESKIKGKIVDTFGTNMFFAGNEGEETAELIGCAEKQVNFEHYFKIPRDEFRKPFIPSEAIQK